MICHQIKSFDPKQNEKATKNKKDRRINKCNLSKGIRIFLFWILSSLSAALGLLPDLGGGPRNPPDSSRDQQREMCNRMEISTHTALPDCYCKHLQYTGQDMHSSIDNEGKTQTKSVTWAIFCRHTQRQGN